MASVHVSGLCQTASQDQATQYTGAEAKQATIATELCPKSTLEVCIRVGQ